MHYPKHKISIKNFGPIDSCEMEIGPMTVITGAQASGKSTIAKCVYFFRTIRDEIVHYMEKKDENSSKVRMREISRILETKFLGVFSSAYIKPDTELKYNYGASGVKITKINVTNDEDPVRVRLHFSYSSIITEVIGQVEEYYTFPMDESEIDDFDIELSRVFGMAPFISTLFIPNGRSAFTIFLEQFRLYGRDDVYDPIMRQLADFIFSADHREVLVASGNTDVEKFMFECSVAILKGAYYQEKDGTDMIYVQEDVGCSVRYASSGQQEALWIINFCRFIAGRGGEDIFLIVEEPESCLDESAQLFMGLILSAFVHMGNAVMLTSHRCAFMEILHRIISINSITDEEMEDGDEIFENELTWVEPGDFALHLVKKGTIENVTSKMVEMLDDGMFD
jgi:predicted ATPase